MPPSNAAFRIVAPASLSVSANSALLSPNSSGDTAPRMCSTASKVPGTALFAVPPPPCRSSATTCTVPSSNGTGASRGLSAFGQLARMRPISVARVSSRSFRQTVTLRKPTPVTPVEATSGVYSISRNCGSSLPGSVARSTGPGRYQNWFGST